MNGVVVANALEAMVPATDKTGAAVAGQEIAVGGTAVGVGTLPVTVTHALISVKTKAVVMRMDGTDPAAGAGILLPANYVGLFKRPAVNAMRFLEAASGEAGVVHVAPLCYAG